MRMIVNLLVAGLVLSSASAFAATKSSPAKQSAPAAPTATTSPSSADRVYCLEEEPGTGSRVYSRECKTKSEWARRGVDVDNLKQQQ